MDPSSLTLGFLPGWAVYEKALMDRFLKSIIQGIRAAAIDHGCNLLVACGVNRNPGKRSIHTAWPLAEPDCDFIPVGDWNTDGLIVLSPVGSEGRRRHIRRLKEEGFPVVFLGSGEGAPFVGIDNAGGIRQSVEHLVKHGHRRIAFIAGDPMDPGDSTLRLQAFREAMADFESEVDPRLVAYGHHNTEDGRKAMEQILSIGTAFTAVIVSNDASAFGAMDALRSAGRRIPMDVALIGFDDHPLAAGQVPPMTSVRYPMLEATACAVETLLQLIQPSENKPPDERLISSKLIARQSCGCLPAYRLHSKKSQPAVSAPPPDPEAIGRTMQGILQSAQSNLPDADLLGFCRKLIASFQQCLNAEDPREFHHALQEILASVEAADDHVVAWQEVVSTLRASFMPSVGKQKRDFAEDLLHQARLIISDAAARKNLRRQMQINEFNHRIHWMAFQMSKTDKEKEILDILVESLPGLGIRFAQAVFFEPSKGDPYGGLRFSYHAASDTPDGGEETTHAFCCDIKDFPPTGILPLDKPFALALLPLVDQEVPIGFIAFDAGNVDMLASVTQEVMAALKTARMLNQVADLSLSDSLTGVQNRRYFSHFLNREVDRCRRYGRSMALMMMDLDEFREYNDSYGSSSGDEALKAVARCISTSARRGSDIVCRYDGDAFAVILPETGPEGALAVAETIRSKVRRCNGLYGELSISIGVAVADTDSYKGDSLVDCANRAMYHAKSAGRNQTVTLPVSSLTQ
jgi:diguanylate cyclase (GGDEF)-like protein